MVLVARKFEKPSKVNGEDCFSKIPEDCMREIFRNVTQDDLDELVSVSQRLFFFSQIFRPEVPRAPAIELKVFKTIDGERYVDLVREAPLLSQCFMHETNGRKRIIEYIDCKPYNNWARPSSSTLLHRFHRTGSGREPLTMNPPVIMVDLKTTNVDLSFIIKQAAFLMSRYTFKEVTFNSVLVDDNFVSSFEKVRHKKCTRKLKFHNTSLVDPEHSLIGKRMLNLLLAMKPSVLQLDARGIIKDVEEIDENFLREFTRGIRSPELFARSTTKKPFLVGANFGQTLASFDSLVVDRLKVGTEWILPVIMNRLRRQRGGTISCAISRIVNRYKLIQQLESDIEYVNVEGRIVLRLSRTDWYADLKTTDGKPCRLFVTFTRRGREIERENRPLTTFQ